MDWSRRAMLHSGASAGVAALGARRGETAAAATRGDGGSQDVHWESVHRDLCNSGRDPDSRVPDQNISVALETDRGYGNNSYVVIDENKIVIADELESNIDAWERKTGDKLWNFNERASNPPAIDQDGNFYFSTISARVLGIDDSGSKFAEASVSSAAELFAVDDHVLSVSGIGEINLFDQSLDNRATYPRPGDVTVVGESTVIDDLGRVIYLEVEQGEGPTHLRMLELPDNPAETDSLNLLDKVPVTNAETGATLHNGNYIWSRENGKLKIVEIKEKGFGNIFSADVGRTDIAPVVIDGDIWAAADEDVYRVPLADIKSDGSADVEIIDDWKGWFESIVAGENTVVVGNTTAERIDTRAYDVHTGEIVKEWNDGYTTPIAIDDGKLFMKRLYGSADSSVQVLEGDYRELGPDITGYSVEYSGIVGDPLTAEVILADPASGVEYAWAIRDADGTPVQQSSGAPTWEVTPALEVGETYEVAVEVTFQGVTERRATTITPAPPPLVGDTPPQDHDGDGRYEDIRGTGEATILDTQALFEALEDGGAQEYPQAFDFSGASPNDEVTILDVAAHWRFHVAGE